ncbi:MAG: T9SS type A sorting domain-containing protein [Flavobacteriales bacterium]|nr:T9SS type A sorting domain-containing protein [Flavobacteriales bacterium]
MKRTILSLALLMLCFPVLSQDCYNVYLGLDSYISQDGPEAVFWELVDSDDALVESGVAQYSMNDPYYDQVLCLQPGCYTLNAEVNGFFNPMGIEAYLESDIGEINDLMISMLDLGLAIEFCLSAPAVNCPETISFEQVGDECAVYIATVDGYDGPVIWDATGFGAFDGDESYVFDFWNEGVYDVCATILTDDCETTICTSINVDCFDNCELYVGLEQESDCGPFVFYGENENPDLPIWWWVEGQNIESEGNVFTFMPEEAGVYTICAGIETPECPFGTTECITIEVPEGCFETEDCTLYGEVEALTCDVWLLELSGNLPWEVIPGIWLDNEYYGQGMSATFLLEPGWHTVCAGYESEACEGEVEWCTEFYVEECECPYYVESWVDGCQVFLEIPQADPNAEVLWEVNGVTYEGGGILDVIVSENGYYTGCAVYNDPFCQDLVLCFDFGIDGCEEETGCFLQVSNQLIEGTTYLFEANAPDNATVWWTINDEVVDSGNLFDYEFNAFGQYDICAFYETPECPEGVLECVNIVVADEFDCTPVVIYFDAVEGLDVDVDIEYIIEGLGFELEGMITIQEECGSTILELCVPDGCYQVTMSFEEFEDLALYLAIFIDNGLPIEYDIDLLNQTVTIEMGVNDDCATDIASAELESLSLFPNPVNETLNVIYPNDNNEEWMIFDSKGSLVEQGNLNEFGVLKLNTSHWKSGVYVLHIEGDTKVLTQRFQVVH